MELKEFVTKTILDIVDGVRDAQLREKEQPDFNSWAKIGDADGSTFIEFDLVLEKTQGNGKKRGIGVALPEIATAGLGKEKTSATKEENRIRFRVPIVYPTPVFPTERRNDSDH